MFRGCIISFAPGEWRHKRDYSGKVDETGLHHLFSPGFHLLGRPAAVDPADLLGLHAQTKVLLNHAG